MNVCVYVCFLSVYVYITSGYEWATYYKTANLLTIFTGPTKKKIRFIGLEFMYLCVYVCFLSVYVYINCGYEWATYYETANLLTIFTAPTKTVDTFYRARMYVCMCACMYVFCVCTYIKSGYEWAT